MRLPGIPVAVQHAGGRFPKAVYVALATVFELSGEDRATVIDIIRGLPK
jgi:hypothetical protein